MEQQDIFYRKADYIETANNNKVSRQSVLCGSQNIVLGGEFSPPVISCRPEKQIVVVHKRSSSELCTY